VAVAVVGTLIDRAEGAARGALIATMGEPEHRVRLRAHLRAVTTVGITLGGLVGALALVVDSPWGYRAVVALDAATFLATALVARRLRHLRPTLHPGEGPRLVALRDRPFLADVVYASSCLGGPLVAEVVLVLGALAHVAGELLPAAGSWAQGFGLAPQSAQGQYQGLFSTGFAATTMLAPAVLTAGVVGWGAAGLVRPGRAVRRRRAGDGPGRPVGPAQRPVGHPGALRDGLKPPTPP